MAVQVVTMQACAGAWYVQVVLLQVLCSAMRHAVCCVLQLHRVSLVL